MSETFSWTLEFPTPPATALPSSLRVSPPTIIEDWGTDFGLLDDGDIDPSFRLESGDLMLKRALARRLLTPRGSLDFHPDYGLDLRQYLHRRQTKADLEELRLAVANEFEKDERVAQAECVVKFITATQALELEITVETQRGPFSLVMLISPTLVMVR